MINSATFSELIDKTYFLIFSFFSFQICLFFTIGIFLVFFAFLTPPPMPHRHRHPGSGAMRCRSVPTRSVYGRGGACGGALRASRAVSEALSKRCWEHFRGRGCDARVDRGESRCRRIDSTTAALVAAFALRPALRSRGGAGDQPCRSPSSSWSMLVFQSSGQRAGRR